jgi:hypothetical protein
MMPRHPTDDEKKSQRDILTKYNKEDLIELLMLSQLDIWNIHGFNEKQKDFIKDIQRDFLKVISKNQGIGDQQTEELIKMMQTVKGIAFSNHPVCDMNMNVTEAEFNAISNQLCSIYRTHSTQSLGKKLKSACDEAANAAIGVTTGKQNFKEAVIKKMVFEKLYHERKDKEIGKRTGKAQIAEIRDRERRCLFEMKQQGKAMKEGKAFKYPFYSPYQSQFQQPYGPSLMGTGTQYPFTQTAFPYGTTPQEQAMMQSQYNPWMGTQCPSKSNLYRPTGDFDYYSDDLEDTEWEGDSDDLSHTQTEEESDGIMVPDLTRFVGKTEMKHQGGGGSKTPPKKPNKKEQKQETK